MSYLIVGASSGLGREIAYSFARRKHNLILIARDERDLSSIKSDLILKFNIDVEIISLDFSNIKEINNKLLFNKIVLKNLDGVLFPIGLMFEKDNAHLDEQKINEIVNANFLSITFLISNLLENFNKKNYSIIGFGSVSGLLGRNINVYYAASKRALESFLKV